ncbi:MAG: molybdopterin-dependent oxidoreductase [Calditrichia bacterium]
MPLVKIDNRELEVEAGITILEAAKRLDIDIPHYCYHKALKIVASCRMCLVNVQGFPKLVPSCSTTIMSMPEERKIDGKYDMVVSTNDKEVKDAQESIMEFLLLNHPTDCPECDQAGECLLQDYSYEYGKGYSRFEFEKRVPPRKDLGPEVLLIATRCILCTRCIRFTQEVTGTNELVIKQRGYKAEIDTFPGVSLNNKMSMNVVDVCPVGALVSKDFLHKPRNWRYEKIKTVCPGCSVGCNIQVEAFAENNEIYRIKPIFNPDVNEWWMCDEGRLFYHEFRKLQRIEYPMLRSGSELKQVNWREALKSSVDALRKFKPEEIAAVGSGFASNEENFMLKKVFADGLGTANVSLNDKIHKEEDAVFPKFVIKGEKVPNLQGAKDMLGGKTGFSEMLRKIEGGQIKALFYLGGDPRMNLSDKDLEILDKLELLIVQDIRFNPLTDRAHIVLAGASAYEKNGTFTNYQGRVQRIRPAIMPPVTAMTDFEILREIGQILGLEVPVRSKLAFDMIAGQVKDYAGIDYEALKNGGIRKGEGVKQAAAASAK